MLLAWALDRDGRKTAIGSLDATKRRERAPFSCLACSEPLVAKLGQVRARHFAHRPGSSCPLTKPETALHLNAKERLLFLCGEAFAGRLAVILGARCPACRRLTPLGLATLGDAAVAEGAAGARRADVLVTRAGSPAAALEVRVTHRIDEEKERALGELGLPAFEIDARETWEEEAGPRPGDVTLRIARTLGVARCPACEARARAEAGRQLGGEDAEVAELEAYRARGLMGRPPGPLVATPVSLSEEDRALLAKSFRCPECGGNALEFGERLARHPCPTTTRPIAWRGYDGAMVELGWWRR